MDYLKSIRQGNLEYAFEGLELTGTEQASDKIPKSRVRISEEVDYSTPGVYPVYYYYTEVHERYTSEAKEVLYVVVE